MLLAGLAVAGIALRRAAPHPASPRTWSAHAFDHRLALVAASFAFAFLVAPHSINFGAFLYLRFLVPAVALGLIAGAPRAGTAPRLYALAAAIAPVGTLMMAAPQLAEASRENAAVDALLQQIAPGSAAAVIHLGGFSTSTAFAVASAGNRVLAERGGRLLFAFTEYPTSPVQVAPAYRWDATLDRVYWDPAAFAPAWDFRRIRYVLVHAADPGRAELVAMGMAPEGRLIGQREEWLLFEAMTPTLPLTSVDAPLPSPAPPSLGDRMRARLYRP